MAKKPAGRARRAPAPAPELPSDLEEEVDRHHRHREEAGADRLALDPRAAAAAETDSEEEEAVMGLGGSSDDSEEDDSEEEERDEHYAQREWRRRPLRVAAAPAISQFSLPSYRFIMITLSRA